MHKIKRRYRRTVFAYLGLIIMFSFSIVWAVLPGEVWVTRNINAGGARAWISLAISDDGSKLVAVDQQWTPYGGYVYASTDGGSSWVEKAYIRHTGFSNNGHSYLAASADGNKLVMAADYMYTSTDGGATWVSRNVIFDAQYNFNCHDGPVASSADGSKLIWGSLYNDRLYTSSDGGVNWVTRNAAGQAYWQSIAASDDGSKLAALAPGLVLTSTDGGLTWVTRNIAPNQFSKIVSSSDGSKLVVNSAGPYALGYIYTSTDSGETWVTRNAAGLRNWSSVACSHDGQRLIAVAGNGYIYTSLDSGATWTENISSGVKDWSGVACSAEGTKLAAFCTYWSNPDFGYIYISSGSFASTESVGENTYFKDGSAVEISYTKNSQLISKMKLNENILGLSLTTETFSDVTMGKTRSGKPYLNIPPSNPIAATINADNTHSAFVTATFTDLPKDRFPAILLNGQQITDTKGNIFQAFAGYLRNINWDSGTGTLIFEITHFSEWSIPALEAKTFTGSAAGTDVDALGSDIEVVAGAYSNTGDADQDRTVAVQKISGLAYATVLCDVPGVGGDLYKPMVPSRNDYSIHYGYINRGNDNDEFEIEASIVSANPDHFGYTIVEVTKNIAPWQIVSFSIDINNNAVFAYERATINTNIKINGVSAVSYNAYAGATSTTFGDDGVYGGEEDLANAFIFESEGYSLKVMDRIATINSPLSNADMIPGTKIKYEIVILNESSAVATSINVTDVIANNCHLYYDDAPDVVGADAWVWKGATDNMKTSADTDAVKYEITIPANGTVTASYTVTLD